MTDKTGTDAAVAATAGAPRLTMEQLIEKLDTVFDCSDCSVCKDEIVEVIEQLRMLVAQRAASVSTKE